MACSNAHRPLREVYVGIEHADGAEELAVRTRRRGPALLLALVDSMGGVGGTADQMVLGTPDRIVVAGIGEHLSQGVEDEHRPSGPAMERLGDAGHTVALADLDEQLALTRDDLLGGGPRLRHDRSGVGRGPQHRQCERGQALGDRDEVEVDRQGPPVPGHATDGNTHVRVEGFPCAGSTRPARSSAVGSVGCHERRQRSSDQVGRPMPRSSPAAPLAAATVRSGPITHMASWVETEVRLQRGTGQGDRSRAVPWWSIPERE